MEWAGRRSASLAAPPWKELGTGPVAFSTLCLWQLLSQGTGPDTAAWHSCPLSLWTVASHTPVEASWTLPWPTVPVEETSLLSWAGKHGGWGVYCLALSSNPSNMFHYIWMKNNLCTTLFTPAVIRAQEAPHSSELLQAAVSYGICI